MYLARVCRHLWVYILSLPRRWRREYLWRSRMTKTRWGFPARPAQRRAHAAPLPLPLCPCLSHFVCGRNSGEGVGLLDKEHMATTEHTVTGRLIHNSIITENLLLRLSLLRFKEGPVDELWIPSTKQVFVSECGWDLNPVTVKIWTFAFFISSRGDKCRNSFERWSRVWNGWADLMNEWADC